MKNKRHTFVEKKITEKVTQYIPITRERAKLDAKITPSMIDAEKEIAKAFELTSIGLGYAMGDMNRVDGGGVNEPQEEYTETQIKILETLSKFKKQNPLIYGTIINMASFCNSFEDEAKMKSINVQNLMAIYVYGLNQWCILRGWGEQIK